MSYEYLEEGVKEGVFAKVIPLDTSYHPFLSTPHTGDFL